MMLQRLAGVTAFVFTILAFAGVNSATSAGDVRLLPMKFELAKEGPVSSCGNTCRTFISAVGAITKDTPSDFANFARDRDLTGATLVLDSSGGSVLGTLSLGRNVRRLGVNTTVGKLTRLPVAAEGADRVALAPRADCESMCAYLLLAGKQRYVPAEAQVLVHEIWLGDRREDAAAASYSAEDIVVVQRDIGRLAQYTVEMGGSIDLLETSLRIPPWEPMRRLKPAELLSMGLDTSAGTQNTGSTPITAHVSPPMPRVPPSERGWVVNEKAGQTSLRRRHPLTVEGDEIGAFELTLACSSKGSYELTYMERRRNGEHAAEPLKQVEISIGRRSVMLKINTSEIKQTELASLATGSIPAELVDALGRDGGRSLMVTTSSGNDVLTTTRVGNSGVPQYLPQLVANCNDQQVARIGAHAELAPAKAAEAGIPAAK